MKNILIFTSIAVISGCSDQQVKQPAPPQPQQAQVVQPQIEIPVRGSPDDFTFQDNCSSIVGDKWSECAGAIEKLQLEATNGAVTRTGHTLVIKLQSGQAISLVDDTSDTPQLINHTYRGFRRDAGYYLIERGFYEGSDYLLISSSTGEQTTVVAVPTFSPDLSRYAVASLDLDARYNPNSFHIWRIVDGKHETELSLESGNEDEAATWGASGVKWIDNNTVEFDQVTQDSDFKQYKKKIRYVLREGTWEPTL